MPTITTRIEIAAAPATVRAKFLQFEKIPTYTNGFLQSITPATNKPPTELVKGDIINCVVGGGSMKFSPPVLENSPQAFIWEGNLLNVFIGAHAFRFERAGAGADDDSSTVLVQEEKFRGILAWIMGESWLARWIGQRESTRKGFEGFNRDFKRWVEGK